MRYLLAAFLIFSVEALAHDRHGNPNWINIGRYVSPVDGSLCCGEHDCALIESNMVREAFGGLHIAGDVDYPPASGFGARRTDRVDEFIPHREVQTSRDGNFWRCKKPDGSRRCFFAPASMM